MKFKSYTEAIEYLYNKAPMYSRIGKSAYKANLENTNKLDKYFNHPHLKYKTIHIAGTNGKGSVSHTIASIIMEAGYKTGLYTSPHLKDFKERIKINGINIKESYIIDFLNKRYNIIEQIEPSFFEITTLMAFNYFKDEQVDIAVIETGLGGRLDSTNIINPILSIITNIGWDHSDLLGDSLEKIAYEKAGIIKKNIPVIIGEKQNEIVNVFINKATQENSDIIFADENFKVENYFITQNQLLQLEIKKNKKNFLPGLKFQLIGFYQVKNVPTILQAADFLTNIGYNIQETHIYRAFKNVVNLTQFYGRWQIIQHNPIIICDIGHNKPALEQNIKQLLKMKKNNVIFILGFMKDKDLSSIFPLLPTDSYYIFTEANIPRSLKAKELYEFSKLYNFNAEYVENTKEALKKAINIANDTDIIYVGGSTFIVAEVI